VNLLEFAVATAEHLRSAGYAPLVDIVLGGVFVVVAFRCVLGLLGSTGRRIVMRGLLWFWSSLVSHSECSPEWEAIRKRIEPYVSLVAFLVCSAVGICGALLVGVALAVAGPAVPWWAALVGFAWVAGCARYVQACLARVTWAHWRMRNTSG